MIAWSIEKSNIKNDGKNFQINTCEYVSLLKKEILFRVLPKQ